MNEFHYIIYSNGKDGYGLYGESEGFPQGYRHAVEQLFNRSGMVVSADRYEHRRCYRFAPLEDAYLFSAIYKECTNAEEKRPFFASVNWLFTAEQADWLLQNNIRHNLTMLIQMSDKKMAAHGYQFPAEEPFYAPDAPELTADDQLVLSCGAYGAAQVAARDGQGMWPVQALMGRSKEQGLFNGVFRLLKRMMPRMRKTLSYCVGFSQLSETANVALAVTYDEVLRSNHIAGNYSGAMAVSQRITYFDEQLTPASVIPDAVSCYDRLSEQELKRANELFYCSENAQGYWQYIEAVVRGDLRLTRGAQLVCLLGETAFLEGVAAGLYTDDDLLCIYEERDLLLHMPQALQMLDKQAKPLYDNRMAEQAALFRHEAEVPLYPVKEKKGKKSKEKREDAPSHSSKKEKNKKADRQEARHSKKAEKPSKAARREKAPAHSAHLSEEVAVLHRIGRPLVAVLVFLVAMALFCGANFLVGWLLIFRVATGFAYVIYGVQLVLTTLISMVIGYLLLSYIENRFRKTRRQNPEKETEGD